MQLLNASQIKFAAPLQRLWRNRSKLNKLPRKWFNYVSVPERVLLPNTDNYGTELRPQIDMEDTIRIFIMFLVSDGDFCQTLAVPWWCALKEVSDGVTLRTHGDQKQHINSVEMKKFGNEKMADFVVGRNYHPAVLCAVRNESITITAYSGLEATYCNNSLNEHDNCRHP